MATTITLEGAARTEFGKGAARRMRQPYSGHRVRRRRRAGLRAAADEGNHSVPASHQRSVHHQVR